MTMGWLSLLLAQGLIVGAQNVTIYGPSVTQALFDSLNTAFSFGHAGKLQYVATTTNAVPDLLAAGNPVVVTSLDTSYPDALTIPLYGFPLVIVYNLDSPGTLVLSQEALLDIFMGRIVRWNDEDLVALNPRMTFPDAPITLVVGSLLSSFVQGLSAMAGDTVNSSFVLNSNNSVFVSRDVCSKVSITPASLGFSWMADVLKTNNTVAFIQNKDGFFANPATGVPYALREYHAVRAVTPAGQTALPHNMPGPLSYPLIGLASMLVPTNQTQRCANLKVIQQFMSEILSHGVTARLAQVLGWEPADGLGIPDNILGKIGLGRDYQKDLDGIYCDSIAPKLTTHIIGASAHHWAFVLNMLAAYSAINPDFGLSSSASNITFLLTAMSLDETEGGSVDIDMSFTWQHLVPAYPKLYAVPAFMGAIVPLINLGPNVSITLSVPVIAQIYQRSITRWNDSEIQALNPGVVLPTQDIIVFAAPLAVPDGPSTSLKYLLESANLSTPFSWSQVNCSAPTEVEVMHSVLFTQYSIGYFYAHSVFSPLAVIPNMLGATGKSIPFSQASLIACWSGRDDPDCWPFAVPLAGVVRRPGGDISCKHQKLSVDFLHWILQKGLGVNRYLVPNSAPDRSVGDVEYCQGRSLLYTIPEPQVLPAGGRALVLALASIGIVWSIGQVIALAIARNHSVLRSASVLFSLLAVVGAFLMLLPSFLLVENMVTTAGCGASVWFLSLGFSLTFGSLFAKLFRLYKIFTSRSLVVPRLSNTKLFYIVLVFLCIDFVLLLIYNIWTPPEPATVSSFIASDDDLATGYRELTWTSCSFGKSPVLYLLIAVKVVVAMAGAAMAFFIRQVDRRFSATSALGGAFYNMFITVVVVIVLMVFFSDSDQALTTFVPVLCGLWIIFVTLAALTLDSNVLLACQDFSKPLRKLLNMSHNSKDSKDNSPGSKKNSDDKDPQKRSHSTIFIVNREMFPSKYENFENELLEQILDELNFQRAAVRRAIMGASSTHTQTTPTIQLADHNRHRLSTQTGTLTPSKSHDDSYRLAVKVSKHEPDDPTQTPHLVSDDSSVQTSPRNSQDSCISGHVDDSRQPAAESKRDSDDSPHTPNDTLRIPSKVSRHDSKLDD